MGLMAQAMLGYRELIATNGRPPGGGRCGGEISDGGGVASWLVDSERPVGGQDDAVPQARFVKHSPTGMRHPVDEV